VGFPVGSKVGRGVVGLVEGWSVGEALGIVDGCELGDSVFRSFIPIISTVLNRLGRSSRSTMELSALSDSNRSVMRLKRLDTVSSPFRNS
jgi:hypothetical protein